ncbi:MAG: methyltransferase domain-containing protein, partial [Treponema sp.]|nr:methyltransferase domain-containing protein [Treponema sp.]
CLPFEENEFDIVIAAGAWETVLDPCGAISEMERVSKQNVIILYHKGKPHEWQTIQMETEKDWLNFNRTDWKYTPENKNFLINSVEIEKNTSYGAVVYNRLLNCTKESIEITA